MKKINSEEELLRILEKFDTTLFIYFYTPMCGTCKLAGNFMTIVEKMDGVPPFYEINLNLYKELSEKWFITSVPCLVAFKQNKVMDKLYAFQSVTHVYEFIQRNES
ncbi:MAG: thioredoxin family protein [Bacillus sp. (in: Bacteria)]|nr:thioredoxin family protein [Bacillus sp. (in: firmicutes)]